MKSSSFDVSLHNPSVDVCRDGIESFLLCVFRFPVWWIINHSAPFPMKNRRRKRKKGGEWNEKSKAKGVCVCLFHHGGKMIYWIAPSWFTVHSSSDTREVKVSLGSVWKIEKLSTNENSIYRESSTKVSLWSCKMILLRELLMHPSIWATWLMKIHRVHNIESTYNIRWLEFSNFVHSMAGLKNFLLYN